MARIWACLALVAACLAADQVAALDIRGIRPTHIQHYKPNTGKFKCLDGSKEIAFKQVNDDFCDCPDGSDEPGTSACPNGIFYCRNRGHEAKFLSSSFVDDGICDCCDGSDEVSGCKNTCLEKNAAVREGLKQKLADYKKALKTKHVVLDSADAKRHHIQERLQNIPADITAAQQRVAQLAAEKEAADAAYKQAEEEENNKKQQQEATQGTDADSTEGHATEEEQQEHEGSAASTDAAEKESDEERGRRIAAQWTTDPDAAGAAETEAGAEGGEHGVTQEEHETPEDQQEQQQDEMESDEMAAIRQKVEEVERQHTEAQNEVQRLQAEQEELQRQVPHQGDKWLGLAGTCVDARQPQYTYRGCLFGKASQIDNNAGHETSLGNWKGFSEDMTKAMWDGGDFCANAPQRSFTVELECGTETKAWDASEPSTCVYTAKMSTPIACDEEGLAAVQNELQKLLDEEAAIAREIAEAEQAKAAGAAQDPRDEL